MADTGRRRAAFAVAVASSLGFALVTWNVVARIGLVHIDHPVLRFMAHHRVHGLGAILRMATVAGEVVLLPIVVLAGWYAHRRFPDRLAAFVPLAALVGAVLLKEGVKRLVDRPPPDLSGAASAAARSFPSGHAAVAAAVLGACAWLLTDGRTRAERRGIWMFVFAVVTGLGLSRLYLGVHWATDVLAGVALGAGWAAVLAIVVPGEGATGGARPSADAAPGSNTSERPLPLAFMPPRE